jgi:hypothetical protein
VLVSLPESNSASKPDSRSPARTSNGAEQDRISHQLRSNTFRLQIHRNESVNAPVSKSIDKVERNVTPNTARNCGLQRSKKSVSAPICGALLKQAKT